MHVVFEEYIKETYTLFLKVLPEDAGKNDYIFVDGNAAIANEQNTYLWTTAIMETGATG